MNDIRERKLNAFNEIFNAYEIYKGGYKSKLETEITNLKNKLSKEEHTTLYNAFEDYKAYVFNILARSQRVFVKLNENNKQNANYEDLNDLFAPLEDL